MEWKEKIDVYEKAVGVELRLRGINFHSVKYLFLYKRHEIPRYT
jgi:hypothetical protein